MEGIALTAAGTNGRPVLRPFEGSPAMAAAVDIRRKANTSAGNGEGLSLYQKIRHMSPGFLKQTGKGRPGDAHDFRGFLMIQLKLIGQTNRFKFIKGKNNRFLFPFFFHLGHKIQIQGGSFNGADFFSSGHTLPILTTIYGKCNRFIPGFPVLRIAKAPHKW